MTGKIPLKMRGLARIWPWIWRLVLLWMLEVSIRWAYVAGMPKNHGGHLLPRVPYTSPRIQELLAHANTEQWSVYARDERGVFPTCMVRRTPPRRHPSKLMKSDVWQFLESRALHWHNWYIFFGIIKKGSSDLLNHDHKDVECQRAYYSSWKVISLMDLQPTCSKTFLQVLSAMVWS